MERYTKKQRHEIYKEALAYLSLIEFGCLALGRVINDHNINHSFCKKHLPELWLCRNKNMDLDIFLSLNDNGSDYSTSYKECLNQRELMFMFAIEMTR